MKEPNAQIEFEVLCDQYYEATGDLPPDDWTSYEIETYLRERDLYI